MPKYQSLFQTLLQQKSSILVDCDFNSDLNPKQQQLERHSEEHKQQQRQEPPSQEHDGKFTASDIFQLLDKGNEESKELHSSKSIDNSNSSRNSDETNVVMSTEIFTNKSKNVQGQNNSTLLECIWIDIKYLQWTLWMARNVQLNATSEFELPTSSAAHEDNLLQESGIWKFGTVRIRMPECENGMQCIAINSKIRGLPLPEQLNPFVSYMSEDEWKRLPHKVPMEQRPCLLCYRYYTCRFVINMMSHPQIDISKQFSFQTFKNPIDTKGGYKSKHAIYPVRHSDRWLGFKHPIVRFQTSQLRGVYDTLNKRWQILQGNIIQR